MNKRTFVVCLRNKFDADIIDILHHIKSNKISASMVVRELLREFRDRGYCFPDSEEKEKDIDHARK